MKLKLICSLLIASSLYACKKDDSKNNLPAPENLNPSTGVPVEQNPPNTNYAPAFAGQTRVNGIKTTNPYHVETIATTLNAPWGITPLPDGRLLITEKFGRLRIAQSDGQLSPPITGLPAVNSSGQGGLLGICISPQFETDRMVYWTYSENSSGGTITAIAKGKLNNSETQVENAQVIFRAGPAIAGNNHHGSRIIFDQNGYLLVSTGDRSNAGTRGLAQSYESGIGKILRITTNGEPAPGNPNFNVPNALPEIYSLGHRNPQGLAIHPVTGALWQAEHGPKGGDELNLIKAGANYGWPIISYGLEYSGQPIGQGIQQQAGMEQPIYYWDPVIAPCGISFYKGDKMPEWQNNLFVAALGGQHIARLLINNERVVGEERLLSDLNQRIRDITQGTDQALYAITDAGWLIKIDRK